MAWNCELETATLMQEVNALAEMLRINSRANPYAKRNEIRRAIYMALSRAYNEGYEIGQNGQVDE